MKKKGFTLVELLVVISIIAMLTSLVLVSLRGARTKAKDARRMSDLREVANAMELAYDDASAECGGSSAYFTAASAPARICPTSGQYLNPFPANISPNNYVWVNNTSACTPSGSTSQLSPGQWYCVYVQLESESNAWFVASQTGTRKTYTNPATNSCNCGLVQ